MSEIEIISERLVMFNDAVYKVVRKSSIDPLCRVCDVKGGECLVSTEGMGIELLCDYFTERIGRNLYTDRVTFIKLLPGKDLDNHLSLFSASLLRYRLTNEI